MPGRLIETDQAPPPGGTYSPGLRRGRVRIVSLQQPIGPTTGDLLGDTIKARAAQTFDTVEAVLAKAEAQVEDVVRATVYLTGLSLLPESSEVHVQRVPDPKPTEGTVGSQLNSLMVEIDVIAYGVGR